MHYRPGQSMTFDSDGLQADVMRFMAIIAFCLIAILALVQNVESPLPVSEIKSVPESIASIQQAQPLEEVSKIDDAQIANPEPVVFVPHTARLDITELLDPVKEELEAVVVELEPVYVEPPQALKEPQPVYEEPPQALYEEQPQTVYEEQPQAVYEEPPQTVYEERPRALYEEQPRALALRFATDDAFVALISAEKIQLFARSENEYYRMGANFGVTPASASGELYDLLPASIPKKIARVFSRVVMADGYLVALPGDMQNELNRYLHEMSGDIQQGGTLVIHRNGTIRYEK